MPSAKPISEKQLAANRLDAKKSTGPNSDAGRKTVRLNAVRHGLTGHLAVLPNESIAAHQAFCSELIDEMAPASAMELNLAQSIAQDLWRPDRAHPIKDNMFAVGVAEDDPDPDHDPAMQLALASARTFIHANKFGLLTCFMGWVQSAQRIKRSVHKNRAALRLMQTERRQVRQTLLEQMAAERAQAEKDAQAVAAPVPIPINSLRPRKTPNGFVCANDVSALPAGGFVLGKAA